MAEPEVPCKKLKHQDKTDQWRKAAPNFIHLLKTMLEEDIETDVTIEIKCGSDRKEIQCHKLILSAHSPVLRTMLSDRWNKDDIKERQIVTCNDDDPDYFQHFVKMMYWDWDENQLDTYEIPVGITPEIAVGVLSLAHKYLACHIIRQAEHLIISFLSKRSANQTVKLHMLLKSLPICNEGEVASRIYRTVLNCLLADGEAIFTSDAVFEINGAHLANIVRSNDLRSPERFIYNRCYKWGQEQCRLKNLPPTGTNVRSVLQQIIMAIRFPLLDKLVITQEVLPTNVLTDQEMVELLAYIVNTRWAGLKTPSVTRFCAFNRIPPGICPIRRLDWNCLSKDLLDFSNIHGFTMSLSKKMALYALHFFASRISGTQYRVHVEFKFLRKTLSFDKQITELNGTLLLHIPKVTIPANTPLDVQFTITGGPTHVSTERVEEMTKEITYWDNKAFFITFKATPNISNGLKQIPALFFMSPDESSDADAGLGE